MVLIASSDKKGRCYIETKKLDGETNKKIRQAEKQEMFSRLGYEEGRVSAVKYLREIPFQPRISSL